MYGSPRSRVGVADELSHPVAGIAVSTRTEPRDGRLLGLDIGTSRCKALVLALDGRELSSADAATPWTPTSTGAEMDAEQLVHTVQELVRRALIDPAGGPVIGVGITAIGQTGLLIGPDGRPLTPLVAWYDTRAREQGVRLEGQIGARTFAGIAGLPSSPLFSVLVVRWHLEHGVAADPAMQWLGIAEWLCHRLGAPRVAERSLASQSGFLDVFQGRWSEELRDWAGLGPASLPDLVDAGTAIGTAGPAVASLSGAVITIGGHDHPCAAVGAGATRAGDVFDSLGTAETIVAAARTMPRPDDVVDAIMSGHLQVTPHVLPGRTMIGGSIAGGSFLGKVLQRLGVKPEESYALDVAAMALPDPGPLDADLQHERNLPLDELETSDPARAWRQALATSVASSTALIERIAQLAGDVERVVVGGGWSRNEALVTLKRQRLSSRLGVADVQVAAVDEPGARGAALLAGVAAGVYAGAEELPAP